MRCSGMKWVAARERAGERSVPGVPLLSQEAQAISLPLGSSVAFIFSALNEDVSSCRCPPRPAFQEPSTILPLRGNSAFFV